MIDNVTLALGSVLLLGVIGFLIALRAIRRDEARRLIHLRRAIESLQHLWKEPFDSDRAPVARQPRFFPLPRYFIDPIRLQLRPMMLPQLRPRQRNFLKPLQQT